MISIHPITKSSFAIVFPNGVKALFSFGFFIGGCKANGIYIDEEKVKQFRTVRSHVELFRAICPSGWRVLSLKADQMPALMAMLEKEAYPDSKNIHLPKEEPIEESALFG